MAEEHSDNMVPLSPEFFRSARVPVDEQTLKGLKTRDDVWELTHRLMKEAAAYLELAGIIVTRGGRPVTYKRDGAVLVGHLIRARKLVRSFLGLIATGNDYGAKVLERPINESLITILYLVKNWDPKEFDLYVRGGLGRLKEALDLVVSDAQGVNHALTPTIQSSVNHVLQSAGLTLAEIDVKRDKHWQVDVRRRLQTVVDAPYNGVSPDEVANMEYLSMFAGPAGNVHGDWADLMLNHLKPVDGGFLPDLEGARPEFDSMLRTAQYLGACLRVFVCQMLPPTEDIGWLAEMLKDFGGRVDALDNYLGTSRMLPILAGGEAAD
jgi:hypothetical protein